MLRRFAQTYPLTQLDIQCLRSWEALDTLDAGSIDLALVTQPCGRDSGVRVRREPLHWVSARGSLAAEQDPLPLAMFAQGCQYRRQILAALDEQGLRWRLAYDSPSRDVLQMAVAAGLAVTVLPGALIDTRLVKLDAARQLPALPALEIMLYRGTGSPNAPLDALTSVITQVLGEAMPAAA